MNKRLIRKVLYMSRSGLFYPAIVFAMLFSPSALAETGQSLYADHCQSCHQADGYGVPFMQPPLAGSSLVLGDIDALARAVLYGSDADVPRDEVWGNQMAGFDVLSDHEMADILTYIRSSFGNEKSAVTADQVRSIRASSARND